MGFCEQLTKLRKRNKMTQTDLANKMNIKQYVISSWETGRSEPSLEQLYKLGDIFNIPTDYLLDKPFVTSKSDEEFNNVIENVKLDAEDEFIKEIFKMCNNLSKEKKKKMLNIIKASLDFNRQL